MKEVDEGKAKIDVPKEDKVSKELEVFYNPNMELNRSISIALLNSIENKDMQIALPLAGSGIRGIRFLLELKNKIKNISMNDYDKNAYSLIIKNLIKNRAKANVTQKDANLFLMESSGFDYIDIDPFGSPNFLLDSACKRISRNGILAVTATDTGALAGTFKEACLRKYFSKPLKNELMHEIGLRILIRKVQLIAAQYEKALMPIYSHSTLHYSRVYFKVVKGAKLVDELIKNHLYFLYCKKCMNRKFSQYNKETCECGDEFIFSGPLWTGQLWDKELAMKIDKIINNKMTNFIVEESTVDVVGFYDIHEICKNYKLPIPKLELLNEKRTHFSGYGIKSEKNIKEIVKNLTHS